MKKRDGGILVVLVLLWILVRFSIFAGEGESALYGDFYGDFIDQIESYCDSHDITGYEGAFKKETRPKGNTSKI